MAESRRLAPPVVAPPPRPRREGSSQHTRSTERALPVPPSAPADVLPKLYEGSGDIHDEATRVLQASEIEAINKPVEDDREESGIATRDAGLRDRSERITSRGLELELDWDLPEEQTAPSGLREMAASDIVPAQRSAPDLDPPPPSSRARSIAPDSGLTLTERHSIPRVLIGPAEIAKLPIDHRGGFLLGHIDGMQTLEEILDVCAMPKADALEILRQLEHLGVIEFD